MSDQNTIIKLSAGLGNRAIWSAHPDDYVIVLNGKERCGDIYEMRCALEPERDGRGNQKPDQPHYCECRLTRLWPSKGVAVEVRPERTRFGFLMQAPDGEWIVVGDDALWLPQELPPHRVQSYADFEAAMGASTRPTP